MKLLKRIYNNSFIVVNDEIKNKIFIDTIIDIIVTITDVTTTHSILLHISSQIKDDI